MNCTQVYKYRYLKPVVSLILTVFFNTHRHAETVELLFPFVVKRHGVDEQPTNLKTWLVWFVPAAQPSFTPASTQDVNLAHPTKTASCCGARVSKKRRRHTNEEGTGIIQSYHAYATEAPHRTALTVHTTLLAVHRAPRGLVA